jgi:CRISPR-associated protein Csx10
MTAQWPLNDKFVIRLTMLSDWHVGSGTGRPGSVDRLIVRDGDGLPFVPAKTLRGIWRDACERLALALDEGVGAWCSLVDRVFGSQPALGKNDPTLRHEDPSRQPIESTLTVRPARLNKAMRCLIEKDRRLLEATTFVKPGVKIDRRRGRAQTDFLRFEELARVGTVLEAQCGLPSHLPAEQRNAASALLIAGTKLVERLGGKRRRGPGRCSLEVVGGNIDEAIKWLENTKTPTWTETKSPQHVFASGAIVSEPWVSVPLILNLNGPLAVLYRTVGNVVESLDYLPGSYLLPHITRTLSRLGVPPQSEIQCGNLVVLPATLEVDGVRGLPVPIALFAHKDDPKQIVNRLRKGEAIAQLKQMRVGYVGPEANPIPQKTPLVVRTHNTVEDGPQRPTSDVGGVYTYEAIAAVDKNLPVRLWSELRLRKSLAAKLEQQRENWWSELCGDVSLGRSKKDDYGEVTIVALNPRDFESTASSDGELVVWLLSDVLLRDERLRPDPTAKALKAELSRMLGVSLNVKPSGHCLTELVRVRRLDTWHVGWGLPRPSFVAMQAGSCVVFTTGDTIDSAKLREIEAAGVGERTGEGYGQIRFNDPLVGDPSAERRTFVREIAGAKKIEEGVIDEVHRNYIELLEREVWKQEIRRAAQSIAAETTRRQEAMKWNKSPPMSQLGGLRAQVSQLHEKTDAQAIEDWLRHLGRNRKRADKWPPGAIDQALNLVSDDGMVWRLLECQGWPGDETTLKKRLWPLAVRTLLDACIRAHKRELEDK